MKKIYLFILLMTCLACTSQNTNDRVRNYLMESKEEKDERMLWWREARFGMFIHWGLYSIPAGEWNGSTHHGEWIRTTAEIPLPEYDQFVNRFNPMKFDAREWVNIARDAGMKYIVITSKHHDGFCLFNSSFTDFDIMSTPYHRDILKDLADACKEAGIRLCFYHSIMDWHHPDYLPRRDWEKDRRAEGADFDRYVRHMKDQLKELIRNYGDIGVLWFDGEWESTWSHDYGTDLYNYVRNMKPEIIVNNRVDVGRGGMAGMTGEGFAGDFGTPEQEIPGTGLPGIDWETCMTMNDHWGYNKYDSNWKSTGDLIRKLADIASKGGNFLLNVGPTSEGLFPAESIRRLKEIGKWMSVNGESVWGTTASPFSQLPWGRCTMKPQGMVTRLYLHVFEWPAGGKLILPGIGNVPEQAFLLSDPGVLLETARREDHIIIHIPEIAPDRHNSVIVLDIRDNPVVYNPPFITAESIIFTDTLHVTMSGSASNLQIRYTVDGSEPDVNSLHCSGTVILESTATVRARCFKDGRPVCGSSQMTFTKVEPLPPTRMRESGPGVRFACYEGKWDSLPDFASLTPVREGIFESLALPEGQDAEYFGYEFNGLIRIPETGVYTFILGSDDGSRLIIDGNIVTDNDGLHGMLDKMGEVALGAGNHLFRLQFFEKTGGNRLSLRIKGRNLPLQEIPESMILH